MSTPTVKSLEDGLDDDESYLVLSKFLTLNNVSETLLHCSCRIWFWFKFAFLV